MLKKNTFSGHIPEQRNCWWTNCIFWSTL